MSSSRLLYLEVENFKSYKVHQKLGPFPNFTCIIGPNGAGKSNIMDAISFVLGISAQQLRSSTGKDLIYRQESGVPYANKAWVSLVLETASGDQLSFKRVINVNGQSEYRVNDKPVPYNQYVQILESQNILVKARNFLVFQGDVEAIASKSPKELTKLFEQVSGSEEYKAEYDRLKELAEKAAEVSQFEFHKKKGIGADLKQFQEQKEEAMKFERLQVEKDNLSLKHILWKLYHMEQEINALNGEIEQENDKMQTQRTEAKKLDKEMKNAKKSQALIQKDALNHERQMKQVAKDRERLIPEKLQLQEEVSHKEESIEKYAEQIEDAERAVQAKETVVSKLQEEMTTVERDMEEFEDEMACTQQQISTLSAEQRKKYFELKQLASGKLLKAKRELESLSEERTKERESKSKLSDQVKAAEAKLHELNEEERSTLDKKIRISNIIEKSKGEIMLTEQELRELTQTKNALMIQEQELNGKLQEVMSLLADAKTDKRISEREEKMNEALQSLKRIYNGVYGKLSDLCKPAQRKFDNPISIILGKNMDSVVVDNTKTALDCLAYMKEQRIGTCTFLPLDSLNVKPLQEKFRNFVKGARLAADVIKCEPLFEKAVHYACGSAVICDTVEIAKFIVYEKKQQVKVVTMDGTIIHKSGFITGGSLPGFKQRNKWEEKDIEAWKSLRTELTQKLNEIAGERRKTGHNDHLTTKLAGLQSRISFASEDLETCERKLGSINTERKHYEEQLIEFKGSLSVCEKNLVKLEKTIGEREKIIFSEEDRIFGEFVKEIGVSSIREYEDTQLSRVQKLSQRKLELASKFGKLKSDVSFEGQQLEILKANLNSLIKTRDDEIATVKVIQEKLSKVTGQLASLEETLEKSQTIFKDSQHELEKCNESIHQIKKVLTKCMSAQDHLSKSIASREVLLERLVQERWAIFRKCKVEDIKLPILSSTKTSTRMDIDEGEDAVDDLELDFKLVDDECRKNGTETMDIWFQDKLRQISLDIERMAPNLKAIEQLEKVEDKFRSTSSSFEQARKEAKAARDSFKEIKEKRSSKFMGAFKVISSRIDAIYKELTKSRLVPVGGTAYLSIENNEEPYLEGIKYNAMPPLKRFRDMEQLSGGEKTVAALALLFAIHSYRPSPFFVLDEVDAALDNANVSRVARYLFNISRSTVAQPEEKENLNNLVPASESGNSNAAQSESDSVTRTSVSSSSSRRGRFGPQLLVISLKNTLYDKADALVGVYRDQVERSSRMLSLDLSRYANKTGAN